MHATIIHIILIDMTTKKQKLQKQQAIDTWIVIALWVSAIWFSLARGFITGIGGWVLALLGPWALIVSCICLAIISRQMKKRHASKDHLTTIVRVSFIVMSISLFICGLAMPDFSDMETFSTLSVYTNNAISFETSKTIAIISGFVVVLSLFVTVTFGIAEDRE